MRHEEGCVLLLRLGDGGDGVDDFEDSRFENSYAPVNRADLLLHGIEMPLRLLAELRHLTAHL